MAWEYKTLNWHIATTEKTTIEYVYEAGAAPDAVRTIAENPRGETGFPIRVTIDDVLDEYGRDDWELVSAIPLLTDADAGETTTMAVRYTLKRLLAQRGASPQRTAERPPGLRHA